MTAENGHFTHESEHCDDCCGQLLYSIDGIVTSAVVDIEELE